MNTHVNSWMDPLINLCPTGLLPLVVNITGCPSLLPPVCERSSATTLVCETHISLRGSALTLLRLAHGHRLASVPRQRVLLGRHYHPGTDRPERPDVHLQAMARHSSVHVHHRVLYPLQHILGIPVANHRYVVILLGDQTKTDHVAEGMVLILHVLGFFAVVITLWVTAPRADARTALLDFTNYGGWSSDGLSAMIGLLAPMAVLVGYDCSVHMCKHLPSRTPGATSVVEQG
jgi:hypothetical protein